jgi:pimeloyl-ACP methyl ester carboxylesterase
VVDLARRRLVTGGLAASALVAGGAGGVVATRYHGTRRVLHGMGVVPGPDRAIPSVDAHTDEASLTSVAMGGRAVTYAASVLDQSPRAALICLHGRGGNHRDAFDHVGIHKFIAAAGLPIATASIDGGESFWRKRADGTDAQALAVDELVAGARIGGLPLGVIGWSMGGYGALLAAIQRPGTFRAVVANGPSIWYSAAASPAGAFDDQADYERNDVLGDSSALASVPTLVDAGEDDYFADAVRDLHRRVPSLEGGVHTGFHDDASWRSWLPRQLEFLRTHLLG